MTLINYISRVHFADRILEDALHSEMELNRFSRPLIVYEDRIEKTEFYDRLISGIPYRSDVERFKIANNHLDCANDDNLMVATVAHDADVIIAFGSAHVISVAGHVCTTIRRQRMQIARPSDPVSKDANPAYVAIPGIDGMPNFSLPSKLNTKNARAIPSSLAQPKVIICDPTLTVGESPEITASSAVSSMVRCVEAFVSEAYNPPADGIALDGLIRTAQNLHQTLETESLDGRRELMAASLNGTLVQHKGRGMVQMLVGSLATEAQCRVDEGAIARLLLPVVLDLQAGLKTRARHNQIKSVFSMPLHMSLREGMSAFLADLPLPQTLSELGLTRSNIQNTIRSAQMSWGPDAIDEETLMSMMTSAPDQY